jgi:hypothetical protein
VQLICKSAPTPNASSSCGKRKAESNALPRCQNQVGEKWLPADFSPGRGSGGIPFTGRTGTRPQQVPVHHLVPFIPNAKAAAAAREAPPDQTNRTLASKSAAAPSRLLPAGRRLCLILSARTDGSVQGVSLCPVTLVINPSGLPLIVPI